MDANLRTLRLEGATRGVLIAWGIAIAALFGHRAGGDGLDLTSKGLIYSVLTGLFLQALGWLVRILTARYERRAGLEGQLTPMALYIFELLVDSVTVFLFALATYRGILQFADST